MGRTVCQFGKEVTFRLETKKEYVKSSSKKNEVEIG